MTFLLQNESKLQKPGTPGISLDYTSEDSYVDVFARSHNSTESNCGNFSRISWLRLFVIHVFLHFPQSPGLSLRNGPSVQTCCPRRPSRFRLRLLLRRRPLLSGAEDAGACAVPECRHAAPGTRTESGGCDKRIACKTVRKVILVCPNGSVWVS